MKEKDRAEKIRAHIFVSGGVQGVWFRKETKGKADGFGIFGWVKNLPDGRVEAVFEGDKQQVEQMIIWAKRGPFSAKVNGLGITWEEYRGEFNSFDILIRER